MPIFMITYTTAPESYDGFGTKTIAVVGQEVDGMARTVRKVETPVEYAEWQRGRYLSGMCLAIGEREWHELVASGLYREFPGANTTQ